MNSAADCEGDGRATDLSDTVAAVAAEDGKNFDATFHEAELLAAAMVCWLVKCGRGMSLTPLLEA
jgi:hypothetical protein